MKFLPNVPRCQHLKVNGTQCGSPALRRNRFCFFHKRFQEEKIELNCDRARRNSTTFILPVLEDADSIQVSLMQIMSLLLRGQIEPKHASQLLYALQTATLNLRNVTIEPDDINDVVIDRSTIDQTCIGGNQWNDEDFDETEEEEDEQDAEDEEDEEDGEETENDDKEIEEPVVKNQPAPAARPQPALQSGTNPPLSEPAPAPAQLTPAATPNPPATLDPLDDYPIIDPEIASRTIPDRILNPPPPWEPSLNEARKISLNHEVRTKRPPVKANPAAMRRRVQDIVLDWLAETDPVKS
jgi:hypothetical protein